MMRFRLPAALLSFALLGFAVPDAVLRGKLVQASGKPPSVEVPSKNRVALEGDEETLSVLKDARLSGAEVELKGSFESPERFRINPFHTKAVFVYKQGKKMQVSYWCNTCSIRSYTPGACPCCQEQMSLDLLEFKEE